MPPVITTDFFTRFWKNARPNWLALLCSVGLALALTSLARAQSLDLTELKVERSEAGLHLSAQLRLDLAAPVEEALLKGVPIYFVAETSLRRDRWYWTDKQLGNRQLHWRLAYQPLTRRWRLSSAAEPLTPATAASAFNQNFDNLSEARDAMQRITRWKIAEAAELEPDARYNLDFRFRLDQSQLPRPLQIAAVGQAVWNLSVSRNQRLPAEPGK